MQNLAIKFNPTIQEVDRAITELLSGFSLTFDDRVLTATKLRQELNSDPDIVARVTDILFIGNPDMAKRYYSSQLFKLAEMKVREAFSDYEIYPQEWNIDAQCYEDLNGTVYPEIYLAMMTQAKQKKLGNRYSIKNDANGWRLESCK